MWPVSNTTTAGISRRQAAPAGFILFVVLIAITLASAVVIGQMNTVQSEAITSLRKDDELQARTLAISCLELLKTYVDEYIGPGVPRADIDFILSNNTGTSTDDNIPTFTSASVLFPQSSSLRWGVLNLNGGACLVRIEDNSDDGSGDPALDPATSTTSEGPAHQRGRDALTSDRDRTVLLSAIGLYPRLTGTTNADVWSKAHARVALRQVYSVIKRFPPPAVRACGSIEFFNNTQLLGSGGLQSASLINFGSGSTCVCGAIAATSTSASPSGCGTPSGNDCEPSGAPQYGPAPPCNPTPTPAAHSYLAISGFGDPTDPYAINVGDRDSCKVFMTTDSGDPMAFIWDVSDDTPASTLSNTYGVAFSPTIPTATTALPPNHDCTAFNGVPNFTGIGSENEVPRPCVWSFGTATATTSSVTVNCTVTTSTPSRSLCWKPIARINATTSEPNFRRTNSASVTADLFEWQSSSDEFAFYKAPARIPFAKDTDRFLAASTAATTFCGKAANGVQPTEMCQSCPVPSSGGPAPSPVGTFRWSSPRFTDPTSGDHSNKRFPGPTIFVAETELALKQDSGDSTPLWATWLTSSTLTFTSPSGFCGAAMPNGCFVSTTAGRINSNCDEANAPPQPYFPTLYPSISNTPGYKYPIVIRSSGTSSVSSVNPLMLTQANSFAGTIEAEIAQNVDQICLAGEIHTWGSEPAYSGFCTALDFYDLGTTSPEEVACHLASPSADGAGIGLCIDDDILSPATVSASPRSGQRLADVVSLGSVCGDNNHNIEANVFTSGNFAVKNNSVTYGGIVTNGNVYFKNNAVLKPKATTAASVGDNRFTAFMEMSW